TWLDQNAGIRTTIAAYMLVREGVGRIPSFRARRAACRWSTACFTRQASTARMRYVSRKRTSGQKSILNGFRNVTDDSAPRRERGGVCDFLRNRQEEIIETWTQRVRSLSPAYELSDSAIVDHLPALLGLIADYVESVHTGRSVSFEQLAKAHAVDRLG